VWNDSNQVTPAPEPVVLAGHEAGMALEMAEEVVFLGLWDGRAVFALDLSFLADDEVLAAAGERGAFRDLREVGPLLHGADAALLAYARALLRWHRGHRFCGRCGHPTDATDGGHVRVCQNAGCGRSHFPRTDPAIIVLVHDGGEHCVLGRQARHPPGVRTTLAGYVEPGESPEEAVAREVHEEVGLAVAPESVRYLGAQPWPFPGQLMLGFHARAAFAPLHVDTAELADAAWYTRGQLTGDEGDGPVLPRRDSIARRLIAAWLAGS